MEEMRKFVCKFCNKRFPCGKSLGGHIRTHMTQHSSNNNITDSVKLDSNDFDAARKKRKKSDLSSDYGLRENPRKTTRFVHSNPTLLHKEKFCRECGKGFPSLKALCGHMACHSEKEKQKLVMMDTQSDTETSDPKSSKRMKFMALNNHNHPTPSVSDVGHEQDEEVAMCLMLLSKDISSHRVRFALVTESNSDNNSAVLEAKSPSIDTGFGTNNGKNKIKNSVYDASELVKEVRRDKMQFEFSDSGYFRYGSKNVDSNISIDGAFRNDVFNRPKVEDKNGLEDYDVSESRKMMNNRCCRYRNTESKKLVMQNLGYAKFDLLKRAKNDYLGRNLDEISYKKKKNGFPNDETYKKGCYDSESYASDEKSTDSTDSDPYPSSSSSLKPESSRSKKAKKKVKSKKRKEHECPICNRTFMSGQALGGHKRSHFVGGFEENNTVIIKQDSPSSPAVPYLIDLNLPAPVDE